MEKNLYILVGPIGSGKTTLAKDLVTKYNAFRISQDEQGRKGHLQEFLGAIEVGMPHVIVDRMGFSKEQRARYIEPARKAGYVVNIVELTTCPVICLSRVLKRDNHPTVEANNPKLALQILAMYYDKYEKPEISEYDNYSTLEG